MFKKSPKGYYYFEILKRQKGLVHGFSGRGFGDCNPRKGENTLNIGKFLTVLGLERKNLVAMEQIHGNRIKVVSAQHQGKVIDGVDGLVTNQKEILLGVRTADCLPILFYDPGAKVIGIAHAGWKGVLKKIPQKMIDLLVMQGSIPENILVAIGPYIGGCCYNIDTRRAERFEKEFGRLEGMIGKKGKKIYLDLEVPTMIQLIHSGVRKKNIEFASVCTACQNRDFFSYRAEGEKNLGMMLGVISLL